MNYFDADFLMLMELSPERNYLQWDGSERMEWKLSGMPGPGPGRGEVNPSS